ncbi:MAG: GNAT family N-acetyltransferase [Anaerolineaceae bacterium]|nr:GNAT family N-acetyltransferase [Anaerolineaceae bacterium]
MHEKKDFQSIVNLIELCFGAQMDPDGRSYLNYVRRVADGQRMPRWTRGCNEQLLTPLYGYVWEEDDRVVGNISFSGFEQNHQWYYLIANVAVHPDYRNRGIARKLTRQAVMHTQAHQVDHVWLQVKLENAVARNLYRSEGFVDQTTRTTWRSSEWYHAPVLRDPKPYLIQPRRRRDWDQQKLWLERIYPDQVNWYFGVPFDQFSPSFLRELNHYLFYDDTLHHFSAYRADELRGVITHQPATRSVHNLWLGTAEQEDEEAVVYRLLNFCQHMYGKQAALRVNYPYDRAVPAFEEASFQVQNHLVWMEYKG